MIVNVRGMSGSGKSTAVKNIMSCYSNVEVLLRHDKKTLLYKCTDDKFNSLIVIGPYESEHGAKGCDVVGNSNQVELLAKYFSDRKYNVLFESYMLSISPTLINKMADDGYNVSALLLEVPLEQVAEQRKNRAINAGKSGEFSTTTDMRTNPKHVINAFDRLNSNVLKYKVSQQNVVQTYFDITNSTLVDTLELDDLWDLYCRYTNTVSKRLANKKFNNELFGE